MGFDLLFVWLLFCFIGGLCVAIFVDKYGDNDKK